MPYYFNPHKHVKVWCSKDPDVFMNLENQVRLVEFRQINPTDELHLLYSKKILNSDAIKKLNSFCSVYGFTPLAIEEDILPKCKSEKEKQISILIQEEIKAVENDAGGNLAAVSDMLRVISPVFKLGVYTDLDVYVDTNGLAEKKEVQAPIVSNIGSTKVSELYQTPLSNNDILIIHTMDADEKHEQIDQLQQSIIDAYFDLSKIVTERRLKQGVEVKEKMGREAANNVRRKLIEKTAYLVDKKYGNTPLEIRCVIDNIYKDPRCFLCNDLKMLMEYDKKLVGKLKRKVYWEAAKEDPSVIKEDKLIELKKLYMVSFKKVVLKPLQSNGEAEVQAVLDINDEDEFLKMVLDKEFGEKYKKSVIAFTGPGILNDLFPYYLTCDEVKAQIKPYSNYCYGLERHFASTCPCLIFEGKKINAQGKSDLSWTKKGVNAQKARETELLNGRQLKKDIACALKKAERACKKGFFSDPRKEKINYRNELRAMFHVLLGRDINIDAIALLLTQRKHMVATSAAEKITQFYMRLNRLSIACHLNRGEYPAIQVQVDNSLKASI